MPSHGQTRPARSHGADPVCDPQEADRDLTLSSIVRLPTVPPPPASAAVLLPCFADYVNFPATPGSRSAGASRWAAAPTNSLLYGTPERGQDHGARPCAASPCTS